MKTYLGDGCYASFDGHAIELTTDNGLTITNRVVLEPEVYAALLRFVDGLKETRDVAGVDAAVASAVGVAIGQPVRIVPGPFGTRTIEPATSGVPAENGDDE